MCMHCQNYDISEYPRRHHGKIPGTLRTPEDIVREAKANRCATISYTYTEPTIFMEFALDTARLAKEQGIRNVFVSNGFMTEESATAMAEVIEGDNVDLKSFRDDFYRKVCKARLQPVLDSIQRLKQLGVWLEVTTLVIPGLNDSEEELTEIAQFIKGVGPEIPWHVSASTWNGTTWKRPKVTSSKGWNFAVGAVWTVFSLDGCICLVYARRKEILSKPWQKFKWPSKPFAGSTTFKLQLGRSKSGWLWGILTGLQVGPRHW